jgi:UV DNA damage endonuclease
MRLGYVSQNLSLGATTGHTLRLANLDDAERVRSIVEANIDALERILRWNAQHDIHLFRLSSQFVPFASHPRFPYDWEAEHGGRLRALGVHAALVGTRLSMHPGQFIQPGSADPGVRDRSIAELRYAARLLSLIGASDLVVHLGGAGGCRPAAADRFIEAVRDEPEILRFLTLENDERVWTVEDALVVAYPLHVPVVLDTLHHALNPGGLALDEALLAALSTWIRPPKVHLSSQDPDKQPGAHAWAVREDDLTRLEDALGGRDVDVMVEAKGKEKAVLGLRTPVTVIGR